MSGFEIFIGGGILICNAFLVGYLLKPQKKIPNAKIPDANDDSQIEKPDGKESSTVETESVAEPFVAPSKFDVDEFMAKFADKVIEEVKQEMHTILSSQIGAEITPENVKFAEGYEDDESDNFIPQKEIKPLSTQEMEDAFNTDERDIDIAPPSAPIATGTSIEELEKAVETAMDENATPEQQADAGKVIEPYTVTQLFEAITSREEIDRRVKLCLTAAIRADLSITPIKKKQSEASDNTESSVKKDSGGVQNPDSPESQSKHFDRKLNIDFDNIDEDNFDIDDFLN